MNRLRKRKSWFEVPSVTGPKRVEQVRVVLRARVGVADQERDRGAGGDAFVHAGEDLDAVFLLALGDVTRRAGAPPVELALHVGLSQRQSRRASVDNAADRRAMALAEVGDAEKIADAAARHAGIVPAGCALPPQRGAAGFG